MSADLSRITGGGTPSGPALAEAAPGDDPGVAVPARPARHPLTWVPSLYLAMGLPNVLVGAVAAILYKNLGVSNEDIALYTSQMYLPWVLKPLWACLLYTSPSPRDS